MPPQKMSKLECEKWFDVYSVDLALRPSEYGPTGVVRAAACLFCECFGREDSTSIEHSSSLLLSTTAVGMRSFFLSCPIARLGRTHALCSTRQT